MDTDAQHTERDRSCRASAPGGSGDTTPPPPVTEQAAERSRSARVPGADEAPEPPDTPEGAVDTESSGPDRAAGAEDTTAGAEPRGSRGGLLGRIPGGRLTAAFLGGLVLLLLAAVFVVQPFLIPSDSMEPAYRDGDRVLVNKLAYRFGAKPERGEVVVFDGTGYFGDGDYIKRVVGVGGDRVTCDGRGRIAVNGRPLDEPYLHPGDTPSTVAFDVVVPEDTLFVLGDHRSASRDSRDHLGSPGGGMIPLDAVVGRADWTVWPPSRWTSHERPGGYDGIPAPGAHHG